MLPFAEFRTYCTAILRAGGPAPLPATLAKLQENFALSETEKRIVAFAFTVALEPAFARIFKNAQASDEPGVLTPRVLRSGLPADRRAYHDLYAALGPGSILIRQGIIEVAPTAPGTVFLDRVCGIATVSPRSWRGIVGPIRVSLLL